MPESILDGTGRGYRAAVDPANRLKVDAISSTFQHFVAHTESNAYQMIGTATPVVGTVNIIHIKNVDSNNLELLPMRIRTQLIDLSGGSSLPNVNNYFSFTLEEMHSSGGSTATPINTTAGSTKLSSTIVHINDPTLIGTAKELERCYPSVNGEIDTWETDGVLIVPPGNSMNVRYVGDHTSGLLYTSVLFVMDEAN